MGGGSSSQSHSIQNKMPWATAEPYFAPMYQKAWDTIENVMEKGQRPYNKEMISDWGQEGRKAIQMWSQGTAGLGQGAQDLANLGMKTAQGGFLPSDQYKQNPYLQDVLKLASERSAESFRNNILPNIRDQAIAQGAYGGARQDLQENRAAQDFSRAANETTQQIGYQDYNDFMNRYSQLWNAERNRMQGAGDILGAANEQFMAKPKARMAMADLIRQNRQRRLDNSLQRWTDANRVAPGWGFNMLPQMAGILTAGDYGTTTKDEWSKQSGGGGGMDIAKSGLGLMGSMMGMK